MMSANAAATVIRAPFGILKEISVDFIFSDNTSSRASAEGCVADGCSAGLEVVTETGERQR